MPFKDTEKRRKYSRNYYHKKPEYFSAERRKRLYGLSQEEFADLMIGQDNRCAMEDCRKPVIEEWAVDHDHASGEVRGILCRQCNLRLGQFEKLMKREKTFNKYLNRESLRLIEGGKK